MLSPNDVMVTKSLLNYPHGCVSNSITLSPYGWKRPVEKCESQHELLHLECFEISLFFFKKSQNGYTPRRWPRARQLRSYSRDCFAPSQDSSGERHAYDLVYLQDADLSEFAMRARAISPSLWVPVLQLNKTTDSSEQVFKHSNATRNSEHSLRLIRHITVKCTVLVAVCQRISLPFLALQANCLWLTSTLSRQRWRGSVCLNPRFMHININKTSF